MKSLWFDKGHTMDPKPAMREMWENIRNNEEVLTYATKVNNDGTDFLTPTLASLILLDYENVDPIAYDVITNIIFSKSSNSFVSRTSHGIHNVVPYFLKEYKLTYLVATLFNDNLYLNEERKNFLIELCKLCYGGSVFYHNYHYYMTNEKFEKEYSIFQGICPIDIRYFVLEHPVFKDMKDKLVKDFFTNDYSSINYHSFTEYQNLMKDYETRAKLRSLRKLPF